MGASPKMMSGIRPNDVQVYIFMLIISMFKPVLCLYIYIYYIYTYMICVCAVNLNLFMLPLELRQPQFLPGQ